MGSGVLITILNCITYSLSTLTVQKDNSLLVAFSKVTLLHISWCSKNQHPLILTPGALSSALAVLVSKNLRVQEQYAFCLSLQVVSSFVQAWHPGPAGLFS